MQKGKYYRMRKELVWGAGILATLLLFFTAFGKMKDTADMPQQEEFTSMEYKKIASSPVGAVGSGGLLSVWYSKGKHDGIFPAV